MDSMDFQLRLKPVMDVSDIQGNLGTLQQYLNKLKLPDSMKSGFKETFANAEKEVTKIQDILGKKTKTKGDVLGLEKSFGNLDKYINKLSTDMGKLSGKKIFQGIKFETPEIKQTLADIQTLQDKLKEKIDTKTISQANAAIKEMSTVSKSVSLERFKQAFKTGDIATASKELQNLKANLKSFDEKGTTGAKYAEGLEKLENIFKDINVAELKEITNQLKQLDSNLDQLSAEQMDKVNAAFKNGVSSVKTFADETDDAGEKISAATKQQIEFNSQVDQLKNNVKNFFSLTNAVQLFRRALRDAFAQMKELDAVMTETAVVTSFDIGDMWDKLPEYTENANKLGVSIKGMYEASTLYYQQGLKTKEAMELSNETMKMARIAGMEAADATDRMTAALRGFNMELNEASAQRVNDVYSKLAAITASDTDEISNAMTKTASIAASAGMEFETTSAFLAQMIETTREAPENLGTAMKTIIARFTEMKEAPGDIFTDLEGEEVNVNKVDAALRSVGVSLKDSSGQFRDLDDVFIELAERWDSLDVMQQRYIATTAAGSRQQSRFIAMMSNYDRTMELVNAATGSAGASQLQYEKTLDSLETKLTRLKNAWTTFTQTLLDNTLVKAGIDILTLLLETINKISGALDRLADGTGAIVSLGAAILAFKGGKSLLNKGLDSILSSFLGKVSVTAEVAGETAALKFQKGVEKGNTATKGTSIFTGAGTAAQGKGVKGGSKAWFSQVGSNISEKWNNARYYGQYDDFLSNQKMVGEEILNARNSGNIEDIQKLGKSYNLSGKELDKFTNAVRNGGPELDKYTNKIAKNKAGIIDQAKASGKSIGQMAAVAAAIVVVTNAIKLIDNAIKTSSEKIAEISTALEETNSKITENQEILDNYQDTKNTYDDMVDSLDKLREGTAEWNQNLIKVNSQTQEIISKYPELIDYVNEVNGAQVMSADGWAAYQDKVTESLQKQYGIQSGLNNQLAQNQLVKNLEGMTYNDNNTIETTTITSEEQSQIKTGTTIGGVAGGAAGVVGGGVAGAAATGALAGSVVPGLGNAVGALVGLLVGGIAAAIGAGIGAGIGSIGTGSGVDPRDAIKLGTLAGDEGFVAENATAKQIDTFVAKAESAGIALGELEDVIREDGAAFDEWVQTNVQAELQKESQRDALISNTIAQNDKLMNSDVLSYVKDTVDVSFDNYDEKFATALKEAKDLGEDQLKSQYSTLMGLTADEIEAKLESKELSEETMQQTIAANNVAEDLASTMEGLITVFENLKEVASEENSKGNKTESAKIASAVLHAVSGEGKGMTQSDIDLFNEKLGGEGSIANLQKQFKEEKISEEDLAKKIDIILGEVDTSLEELGLTAKDFIQNLTTADNLSKKLIETYGEDSVNQVNETLGKKNVLGTSGSVYSIGAQGTIAKAFSQGETEAEDKTIKSIFSNLGKQVTEETVDQYNNLLENMDISDSKSIKDTMKALEDLGFNIDGMTDSLIKATKATHEYTIQEIQSARANQTKWEETLSNRESSNVVFTEEEKDSLIDLGVDSDDFSQYGDEWVYTAGTTNDILLLIKKDTKKIANGDGDNKNSTLGTGVDELSNTIEVFDAAEDEANKFKKVFIAFGQDMDDKTLNKYNSDDKYTFANETDEYGNATGNFVFFTKEDLQAYDAEKGTGYAEAWERRGYVDASLFGNDVYDFMENRAKQRELNNEEIDYSKIAEALRIAGYSNDQIRFGSNEWLVEEYKSLRKDKYSKNKLESEAENKDYWAATDATDLNSRLQDYYTEKEDKKEPTEREQKIAKAQSDQLLVQAAAYGASQKAINDYNKALEANKKNSTETTRAEVKRTQALLAAEIMQKKQAMAVEKSSKKIGEYKKVLNESEKGSIEYQDALEGITEEMNMLAGTDVDYTFFEDLENMQLLEDAINGVDGAYEKLLNKMMAQDIGDVENSSVWQSLGLTNEQTQAVQNNIANIQAALNGLTYTADGKVDLSALYNQLYTTLGSAEAAGAALRAMGFEYEITEETKTIQVPTTPEERQRGMGDYKNQEVTLVTGMVPKGAGKSFSANAGGGSSGGGSSSGGSGPQKNSKKTWHYNRDVKSEKRDNRLADIEHKIAMEQAKQIPNLKTLNNLHKQKLGLLEKEKKQQKSNYDAAAKEEKRLWKQGQKKGYNKLLNKDGTVNLKAYNSKKWKNEKAKEKFDEWESNLEDTREYKQSSKEAKQDVGLKIAELKKVEKKYDKISNLSLKVEGSQNKMTQLQSKLNIELNKTNGSLSAALAIIAKQTKELKKQKEYQQSLFKLNKQKAQSAMKKNRVKKYISNIDYENGTATVDYKQLGKDFKNAESYNAAAEAIDKVLEYIASAGEAYTEALSIEDEIVSKKNFEEVYTLVTNLQLQREASQQRLNKLQTEYNILLKGGLGSSKQLLANLQKQREELQNQKKINQDIIEDSKILAQKELDGDAGKYVSSFDLDTGTYQIDYEQIKIDANENADAYDAIIKTLDPFIKYMASISDSNSDILNIEQQELDNYISQQDSTFNLLDRIEKALENRAKQTIDSIKQIDSNIKDTNSSIISLVKQNLQELRQVRNNTQKEEDLADKQTRLAYLRQYTGGGNAAEIAQLEKELEKDQESYTDTLIDQKISELEKQNNEASEQRQRQIKIMQKQYDIMVERGDFTNIASMLLSQMVKDDGSINVNSEAFKILFETDSVFNMTKEEAANWFSELSESVANSVSYLSNDKTAEIVTNWNSAVLESTSQLSAGVVSLKELFSGKKSTFNKAIDDMVSRLSASIENIEVLVKIDLNNNGEIGESSIGNAPAKNTAKAGTKIKQFKTGGLADFTGPAWLDGTKAKPEIILNQKDTENFIQLKNILADIMKGVPSKSNQNNGDSYAEIHINVEKMTSDYDVDKVAKRVKKILNEDGRYRTVNQINRLR